VSVGDPYDDAAIVRALSRYVADLRGRGYYEAQAVHTASFDPDGSATVRVSVERGLVRVLGPGGRRELAAGESAWLVEPGPTRARARAGRAGLVGSESTGNSERVPAAARGTAGVR